jgi:anaerobic selenocysteine-containing dehydrogenase
MGYQDAAFKESLDERLYNYLSTMVGIPEGLDVKSLTPGDYVESVNKNAENYEGKYFPFRFVSENLPPDQSAIPCLGSLAENDDSDLQKSFPLQLLTPPNGNLLNSTFGEMHPNELGWVLIHPDDAADRNIQQGDRVKVHNRRGFITRKAKVTEDTQPGLVVAEGIYWENSELEIRGVNELTSQATADIGEGGTFHESLVEVQVI